MEALVDCFVTFYRENYERLSRQYDVLKSVYRECRQELYQLRNQYERLEEYAEEQEQRANALHSIMDHYINNHGRTVRRDLLDSFNEVANQLGVELEEFSDDVDSEFETETIDE